MKKMIGISALHFDLEEKINIYHDYEDIKFIECGIDGPRDIEILKRAMQKPENQNVKFAIHLPLKSNPVEDLEDLRTANIQFVSEIIREILPYEPLYFNMHLGHAFYNSYNNNTNMYLDKAKNYLIALLSISTKVNLYIENVYNLLDINSGDRCSIGTKAKEFEYLLKRLDTERIGFCYDLGHALIQKEDFSSLLSRNKLLYHFNVNNGISDEHLGVQQTGTYTDTFFYESIKDYSFDFIVLELDKDETMKTIGILKLK